MLTMKRTNYVGRHRLPEVEVTGARPRVVRRAMWITGLAAIGAAGFTLAATPHAHATPGQCGSGIVAGNGGGFCDGAPRADGHWYHCETVYVLGFGGTNCFWVHPVSLDVDPRGWQAD